MSGTFVPLLRHHWARHRFVLMPISAGLAAFAFLFTRIAPGQTGRTWITDMMAAVPPQMMALAGDQFAVTTGGILAIGYGHPFFLLLIGAWTARVSSGVLAGEIGLGTMDLLAARPVPRWQHVAAGFVVTVSGLALLLAAAWSGTAFGLWIRPLGIAASGFLKVAAAAWLLFAAWAAIGLLIAATRRQGGQALGWLTGIMAVSFVLDYVARIWAPMKGLRPLSLFRYYEPQAILTSGLAGRDATILAAVLIASVALAALVFRSRDL